VCSGEKGKKNNQRGSELLLNSSGEGGSCWTGGGRCEQDIYHSKSRGAKKKTKQKRVLKGEKGAQLLEKQLQKRKKGKFDTPIMEGKIPRGHIRTTMTQRK